ncbi:unnamed protein product [Scytosiphon promiscuus]
MMKKALFLTSFGAGLALNQAGGIRAKVDDVSTTGKAFETPSRLQEIHFSETLRGDDAVTVLEAGGFKLTASCKTVTHTQGDTEIFPSASAFDLSSPPYASSSFGYSPRGRSPCGSYGDGHGSSSMSAGGYRSAYAASDRPGPDPSAGDGDASHDGSGGDPSDAERGIFGGWDGATVTDPCGTPPGGEADADSYSSYRSDGKQGGRYYGHYSGHYYSETPNSFTESFAALELTYTSPGDDYLYGYPNYKIYPNDEAVAGKYKGGESRTQTVFAGRFGYGGETCTFQSMSGRYLSINGDRTIGVHRPMEERTGSMWSSGYTGPPEGEGRSQDSGFPEGVDCMVAGVITYVGEVDRPIKIM